MTAPTCSVTPSPQPGAPTAKTVPSIPVANDLASALRAIQAITQWINAQQQPSRTGAGTGGGGTGGGGGGGGSTKPVPKQPKPQVGRWNETSRTTQTVKIFNPSDHTQFVEVEQLTSLRMTDSITGETWVWTL